MNYIIHRDKDYLEHHGVEGQKWGRRRYQNEDGSYKPGAEGRYDPDPDYEKARNKSQNHNFKGAGKDEWDEIQRRADEKRKERLASGYKYKTKNHRQEDESDAEDDMIREHKEKKKAEKAAKEKAKAEKRAADEKIKQEKSDKRNEKNSYKKVALRYLGRQIATNVIGGALVRSGHTGAGLVAGNAGSIYNLVKTYKDAKGLHDYRKKKTVNHSDYSDYELYHHGILGMHWGIRRYQNEDGTLTPAGKLRYGAEAVTGFYDPKGNNPYVSNRRKKNRLKEIEEYQAYKAKEKKRSDIRKQLKAESKESLEKSQQLYDEAYETQTKANEQRDEAKYLKKHYVAGRLASRAALATLSSMAISAVTDLTSGKDIDDGTLIRGGLLAIASMPAVLLSEGITASKKHKEAEKKYGLR